MWIAALILVSRADPTTARPVAEFPSYRSLNELGPLADRVLKDFPFATERLVLVGFPESQPNCCVASVADADGVRVASVGVPARPRAEDCARFGQRDAYEQCLDGVVASRGVALTNPALVRVPLDFDGLLRVDLVEEPRGPVTPGM